MDVILSRLFLGNLADGEAAPKDFHVVNFCEDTYDRDPEKYIHWPVPDGVTLPSEKIHTGILAIARSVRAGKKCLVHCHAGQSRGPTFVAGYLCYVGYDLMEALDWVKHCRPVVDPYMATFNSIARMYGYEDWTHGTR
jgi:protein-tyrosine phosphatase